LVSFINAIGAFYHGSVKKCNVKKLVMPPRQWLPQCNPALFLCISCSDPRAGVSDLYPATYPGASSATISLVYSYLARFMQ